MSLIDVRDMADGWVELACRECRCVISVRHPAYDLIMYPLCESCRRADEKGCDRDHEIPTRKD